MKTLELKQMEIVHGRSDYGDMTCEEFWTATATAIGGTSFYTTAVFGPAGALGSFIAGTAASLYGLYGC